MEPQTIGKLLPKVLIPYAQQWAQRTGMPLLSKLLEDEHFHALIETYGDEIAMRTMSPKPRFVNGRGQARGYSGGVGESRAAAPSRSFEDAEREENAKQLSRLQDRLSTLEIQHELQQVMFQELRKKAVPLARALGCCPECLVGVIGCQRCGGNSTVGAFAPDEELLEEQVVKPLVARGVPLWLQQTEAGFNSRQSNDANGKEI